MWKNMLFFPANWHISTSRDSYFMNPLYSSSSVTWDGPSIWSARRIPDLSQVSECPKYLIFHRSGLEPPAYPQNFRLRRAENSSSHNGRWQRHAALLFLSTGPFEYQWKRWTKRCIIGTGGMARRRRFFVDILIRLYIFLNECCHWKATHLKKIPPAAG